MDLKSRFDEIDEKVDLRAAFAGLLIVLSLLLFSQIDNGINIGSGSVEVNLTVDKPSGNLSRTLEVKKGTSAFSALNASFDVEYEESSYGVFITSIDGLEQNDSHYWMYVVNGEAPDVGSGQFLLEDDDQVSFRFMEQSEARKMTG
jgi:hypothetical protein